MLKYGLLIVVATTLSGYGVATNAFHALLPLMTSALTLVLR